MDKKVFCIGTWKTGTTSVGAALHRLIGGSHQTCDTPMHPIMHNWAYYFIDYNNDIPSRIESLNKFIDPFSTFDDFPWVTMGSLELLKDIKKYSYILTTRNADEWHYSAYKFFKENRNVPGKFNHTTLGDLYAKEFSYVYNKEYTGEEITALIESDFGGMVKHKSIWVNWYNDRNQKVREMFKDNHFLEYNISDGLGWGPLCSFLGLPIPNEPFPKLNTQRYE